ncbi:hypothetical protein [Limnospira platensis]|uniref:hypothetical protein n=1 Tax=Limnospira platensis TaxID=118562 RepID=UPI003D6F8AEB
MIYVTNAGLSFNERVYLVKLTATDYLVIENDTDDEQYPVGSVVELEDFYVQHADNFVISEHQRRLIDLVLRQQ